MTTKTTSAVKKNIRAFADASLSREETFLGQAYLAVPVVAMVEGVRFGANQSSAELGLATEFGKYPDTWNNRPLMVNHPQVQGEYVSAGRLDVMQDHSFGFIANTQVDDGKLKMEAWIQQDRANDIPAVQTFLDEIKGGNLIEVSVGFFTDVEAQKGTFKSQSYTGIWRNIVPDHLAFLTNQAGACSVEDGCGVPRLNAAQETSMAKNTPKAGLVADSAPVDPKDPMEPVHDCGCGGHDKPTTQAAHPLHMQAADPRDPKLQPYSQVVAQAISSRITDASIDSLLSDALPKFLVENGFADYAWDVWVITYTAGPDSMAVFRQYYSEKNSTRAMFFDITDEGLVTFKGEPFDVRIVSTVHLANEGSVMTTQATNTDGTAVAPAPVAQAVQAVPVPRILSQAEAFVLMSTEDQTIVSAALKLHAEKKQALITRLLSSGKSKFGEDQLKALSTDMLEGMAAFLPDAPATNAAPTAEEIVASLTAQSAVAALLVPKQDFSARQVPTEPVVNNGGYVPAPRVFETVKSN